MSSTVPNSGSTDPVDPGIPGSAGYAGSPGSAGSAGPGDTPTSPVTEPRTRREAASTTSWATSSSGWSSALIVMGILSVVLGVLVLVWPDATLLVVAITFGIQLIIAGAVRLSVSRELPSEPGWVRPVSMVLGVLSVIAGIICLFRPGTSLLVVAILIAVGWIAEGIAAIAQGFGSDRTAGARVFLVVAGVVSV